MRFFLFLSFSIACFAQDPNALHPFTDVNGRTLEAKFIEASAESVKIEWNGQTFGLPLITLDSETQSLVDRLSKTTAPSDSSTDVQKWTDTQGRTIEARFVKSDKLTLTVDWNGKVTTLPLTMFSASSRKLAAELQNQQTKVPETNAPAPKIDLKGGVDLSKEYPWQNRAGKTAYGLFVELGKSELKISMNRGTREVVIPVDSLSKDFLALAKKLQVLASAEQKELAALAKKRKAMKVPAVTEADLEIEHEFINSSGQAVKAQFVEADDKMVSLLMARRSKTPFKLAWTSFADESVAKLEALRRKRVEVDNAKPRIIAAKGNRLSYYGSGKYKGYNTVFETETYAVGVPSTGTSLNIFIKQEAVEDGVPAGPLGILRMSVGFGTRYTDRTNPERPRRRGRGIKSFDVSPEPSTERDEIKLTGKFTNDGTFEYNIRMTRKGLEFWSRIKDPSGEDWPTTHHVGMSFKGTVPKVKDMQMNKIKAVIGDGAFYAQPVEGKSVKLPFDSSWQDLMKKVPRGALNNLKSMEAKGAPYDPVRIVVTPFTKDMKLEYDRSYASTFPLQGMSLGYAALEKKTEIPRNRALKINLLPK
ncbi:MAG TPA: hypothetical protein DCF87_06660 [Opitutae bacterium]|nr:hypothetical protein [Opitutae bacterium]